MAVDHDHRVQAHFLKCFLRDLCRDEGMSVPVAADPASEAHSWPDVRVFEKRRIEAGCFPGAEKTLVELLDREGKDFADVKDHAAPLGGDFGLFEQDFAAAPESLENDLDFVADRLASRGSQPLAFKSRQEEENSAMLFQHRGAFGLGGVRSQHGFNTHLGQDFSGFPPQ